MIFGQHGMAQTVGQEAEALLRLVHNHPHNILGWDESKKMPDVCAEPTKPLMDPAQVVSCLGAYIEWHRLCASNLLAVHRPRILLVLSFQL